MNLPLGPALSLLVLLFAFGCGRSPDPAPRTPPDGPRSFDTRGVLREIAPDRRRAVIRHEEIPGYMPKMTMELNVREPAELEGLAVGDEITFRLQATAETLWIDTIRRVGRAAAAAPAGPPLFVPDAVAELKPGDPVPDAEFLGETGQQVRLADFRGRAVAFTFFFTRCPLPDYCPRMNANFRDARDLLLQRPDAPTNWQFLCISFDADFDQPAVLSRYAAAFRGDPPDRWAFASASPSVLAQLAPRLDLMVAREGGSFAHNLRTVVLDPQGRIFQQLDGNEWTPRQLADALAEAAGQAVPARSDPKPQGFDQVPVGQPPAGWTVAITGEGTPAWQVVADRSAPSAPHALRQLGQVPRPSFPLCLRDEPAVKDGFVEVKFKTISGEIDQAAGVVWRAQDAANYYVCRANALEDNVVLYKIENGKRQALDIVGRPGGYGVDVKVAPAQWQTLRVEFVGPRFRVFLDGQELFAVEDPTFQQPGRVGLWTKADSVTAFDEFTAGGP